MRISDWSSDVCSSDLALFQHDTSRALDPQGHIHAVIANLTRMADGKWKAIHGDKLWSHNSIIGSVYHAYLRTGLEQLGSGIDLKGKNGTFEITGLPKSVIGEYRQRRAGTIDHTTPLGVTSPAGVSETTKKTR